MPPNTSKMFCFLPWVTIIVLSALRQLMRYFSRTSLIPKYGSMMFLIADSTVFPQMANRWRSYLRMASSTKAIDINDVLPERTAPSAISAS
ncbi:unknown [Clostridium sp. CAG:169]|nr:unknown [Clostridium sp. CAG:169]